MLLFSCVQIDPLFMVAFVVPFIPFARIRTVVPIDINKVPSQMDRTGGKETVSLCQTLFMCHLLVPFNIECHPFTRLKRQVH